MRRERADPQCSLGLQRPRLLVDTSIVNGLQVVRVIAAVAGIVFLGPTIFFCFFPAVRAWFDGGPDRLAAEAPEGSRAVVADLAQRGFRALGVKVEKVPLRPPIRELSFVAADARCYASVAGSRHHLYYFTPLQGGGLVLTATGRFTSITSPRVRQRSYPGCNAQQLLEHHLGALASLERQSDVSPTQEARVEATYAYYRTPEVRSVLRRTGLVLLGIVAIAGWLLAR